MLTAIAGTITFIEKAYYIILKEILEKPRKSVEIHQVSWQTLSMEVNARLKDTIVNISDQDLRFPECTKLLICGVWYD